MKNIKEKIFVCILSAIVLFCSIASTSITVYATEEDTTHGGDGYGTGTDNGGDHESDSGSDHGGGGHVTDSNKKSWDEKLKDFMRDVNRRSAYILAQLGAFKNGDYEQLMKNYDLAIYNDDGTINTDTVTYDESTDSITMDLTPLLNTLTGQIGLTVVPANVNTSVYSGAVISAYKDNENYFAFETEATESNYAQITYVYCFDPTKYYLVWYYDGLWNRGLETYSKETLQKENGFKVYQYSNGFEYSNGWVLSSITNTYDTSRFDTCDHNTTRYYDIKNNVPFSYFEDYSKLVKFVNSSIYLGSAFGQNGTITIPVSDLEKDWETAYNTIVEELDGIKEATGERPTQKQIDDAIEQVLGELQDIGGNIGDIGGEVGDIGDDVEEIAKTLDDLYKLLDECHDSLEELNQSLSEGVYNQEQILDSLEYLELIYDNLSQFHVDYAQANAVLLNELEAIKNLLSASLSPGGGQDASGLVSSINTALQDIRIFMKDRLLSVLEDLSGSSADISGALDDANITLEEIKDILSRMEEADIDTSNLEEALEKIRDTISETGEANSADLSGMKELLSDIQDVLIEMKSGMAVKDNYTEVLDNIYSLMQDMYKLQKIGTALEVADLLSDFAGLLDSGDTSIFDRMYTSFSNVANASKERFPTSLPWDLIAVFSLFNAEPVVPHYEIPFVIPSLGINEVMVIDLSEFEQLSKASRTFLSILFVLLLIHLTRKMTATDKGSS